MAVNELGPNELGPMIDRLLALPPGSPEAEEVQYAIERVLMSALKTGGLQAGEAHIDSLASHGYALQRLDVLPWMWLVRIPRPRVLELWFTGIDVPVLAALSYRVGVPSGTKAKKRAAELQAAFYARYNKLCAEPEAERVALSEQDTLVVLVGEFEADVSNGGFRQFLDNKGEQRARETLACLTAIGAKRTARWLSSALRAGATPASLERLDGEFNRKPEDLPVLVMRHIAGGSMQ